MKRLIIKTFRIIGQCIAIVSLLLLGGVLIYLQIPGQGGICDADQMLYVSIIGLFILISLLFMLNSIIFYFKGHWIKYRLLSIIFISIMILSSVFLRKIILTIAYGKEKISLTSNPNSGVHIKLKLYKNGKFYSYTYDISCEEENIGTYTILDYELKLEFKDEKSEFLGTRYKIVDKEVECIDCKFDNGLVIQE